MWLDIVVSALLAISSILMAYLGVHVTLHPAESPQKARRYKWGFRACAIVAVGLVIWQGIRNGRSQASLNRQVVSSSEKITDLMSDVSKLRSEQDTEISRRQQAEKDLALIVQGVGKSTRDGVISDIKQSPISVSVNSNQLIGTSAITDVLLEARATCTLRDRNTMPQDIAYALPQRMEGTFLQGNPGKAILSPTMQSSYQRTETEGDAIVIQKYVLPSNSVLKGQPVARLKEYDVLELDLWGINGKEFSGCHYLELFIRVNGSDVHHVSKSFRMDLDVDKNPGFRFKDIKWSLL